VFASDDPVFAWAIGKALLIAIVSVGILVYAAWAVTWQRKDAVHVGISKDSALNYKSSVKAAMSCSLQAERLKKQKGLASFWLGPWQK